ncbi:MAG TPA: CBS domain-containing protein [Tepidiformaceae bacterium]|nr:CBS domain-containing protein [Tepidiformaceae bacterium]
MVAKKKNIVLCPSCGFENIEGNDSCEGCLSDLRSVDVPETSQVVSESDLVTPISAVAMARPCTVSIGATVRDAIAKMHQAPSGAVVVVSEGRSVGIFTIRDVLDRTALKPGVLDEPIEAYMTPDPEALNEDDSIAFAINRMGDWGFRFIPVTREGNLVGMITVRDVINWVQGRYLGHVLKSEARAAL